MAGMMAKWTSQIPCCWCLSGNIRQTRLVACISLGMEAPMAWLKDLFASAYNLTADQRRTSVRWVCGIAAVVLLLTIFLAGKAAATTTSAEHPLWEIVIKARLALFDGLLGIGKWILTCAMAYLTWNALDNANVGKRLFMWGAIEPESDAVRAAKMLNAGLLLATLLLACAWVMR